MAKRTKSPPRGGGTVLVTEAATVPGRA